MRKIAALMISAILLMMPMLVNADDFDLDYFRERSNLYSIDVNYEDDVAFIESQLSAKSRSFVHKYDSESRYSSTKFDILVINYLESDAYPVMRLWITYCADDNFMNITSASFIFNGKKYTFSGIADKDWYTHDDDGYMEQVLIKFGIDNLDFLADMEGLFSGIADGDAFMEKAESISVKLILHGRENIEADLGAGFFLDFINIKSGMISSNGLSYLSKANATTMKETDVN